MIYASDRGGSRYHRYPDCDGLNAYQTWNLTNPPAITSAEAASRGLTPCRRCQPPPLLHVVPEVSP